jgi:hypothetical protein
MVSRHFDLLLLACTVDVELFHLFLVFLGVFFVLYHGFISEEFVDFALVFVFEVDLAFQFEFECFKVSLCVVETLLRAPAIPGGVVEVVPALEEVVPGLSESVVEILFVLVPALDVLVGYDILLEFAGDVVDAVDFDGAALELAAELKDGMDGGAVELEGEGGEVVAD